MKSVIARAFMLCFLAALLSMGAYAMEVAATEFSEVDFNNSVIDLKLQKASKEEVAGLDGRYFEAERGTLTYKDASEGQRFTFFMTDKAIQNDDFSGAAFLDFREETAQGETVDITFYPMKLSHNTVYYIYLSGSAADGKESFSSRLVATMRYKDYYLGDLNGNRDIDPEDSLFVLEMSAAGMEGNYQDWQEKAADVNRDGEIDPQDALFITEKAANPDMEFPSAA